MLYQVHQFDSGGVGSRRSGSNVIDRVVDPRGFQFLEIGRQMLTSSLADIEVGG